MLTRHGCGVLGLACCALGLLQPRVQLGEGPLDSFDEHGVGSDEVADMVARSVRQLAAVPMHRVGWLMRSVSCR